MAEPTTVELDFTDVKDYGNSAKNVAKGNYILKVKNISLEKSKAGNPMWVVDAEFVDGPNAGETIREYLALTEKALFKVKSWLDAIHGKNLPKKKIKLPNTSAALQSKFGGKLYGAHIDDGDPRTDSNGNEVVYPEVKYHIFPAVVQEQAKAPAPATVTESSPKEELKAEAPAEDAETEDAPAADVADQLESFDLDEL